jgi:hypothetical protein
MSFQKAFRKLVDTLDLLKIPYMVGGSMASSVHGVFRSTNDVDIVAGMRDEHVTLFASELAGDFYADPETIREALTRHRPFNLIHFASGYKFDIFPTTGDPYLETQLERCIVQEVMLGEGQSVRCSLATAEDIVLAKLAWYRAGGEQSERQWNDLRGIRSVQGDLLDRAYMREWARHLEVADLLERLLSEDSAT